MQGEASFDGLRAPQAAIARLQRTYEDAKCEYLLDDTDTAQHYMKQNTAEMERVRRDPADELYEAVASRTNAEVAHNVVTGARARAERRRSSLDTRASCRDGHPQAQAYQLPQHKECRGRR